MKDKNEIFQQLLKCSAALRYCSSFSIQWFLLNRSKMPSDFKILLIFVLSSNMHLNNSHLKISGSNIRYQKDKGYIIYSKHSNCSIAIELTSLLLLVTILLPACSLLPWVRVAMWTKGEEGNPIQLSGMLVHLLH